MNDLVVKRVYRSTEPFCFRGDTHRPSLLLVHGFTSSPSELRRLGYTLHDAGYHVEGIRLPGHGSTPEEMLKTRWEDWLGHVIKMYDRLTEEGRQVIPIGHSMGGLLTLVLATMRDMPGLVCLSAPIYIRSRLAKLAPILQIVKKYHQKKNNGSVAREIIEEAMTYDRTPVPCVVSLQRGIRRTKKVLPLVQAPALIMQGGRDGTVQEKSARYIFEHIGSSRKWFRYYPDSSHGILLDCDREQVYTDILQFLAQVESDQG